MDKTPTVIAYANALREWDQAKRPTFGELMEKLEAAEKALTDEERSQLTYIAPEAIIATYAGREDTKREKRHQGFYLPPETLMLGEANSIEDVRTLAGDRYGESWEKYVLLAFLDMQGYYHRERTSKLVRIMTTGMILALVAQLALFIWLFTRYH